SAAPFCPIRRTEESPDRPQPPGSHSTYWGRRKVLQPRHFATPDCRESVQHSRQRCRRSGAGPADQPATPVGVTTSRLPSAKCGPVGTLVALLFLSPGPEPSPPDTVQSSGAGGRRSNE